MKYTYKGFDVEIVNLLESVGQEYLVGGLLFKYKIYYKDILCVEGFRLSSQSCEDSVSYWVQVHSYEWLINHKP